jgi:hypothetical protein
MLFIHFCNYVGIDIKPMKYWKVEFFCLKNYFCLHLDKLEVCFVFCFFFFFFGTLEAH